MELSVQCTLQKWFFDISGQILCKSRFQSFLALFSFVWQNHLTNILFIIVCRNNSLSKTCPSLLQTSLFGHFWQLQSFSQTLDKIIREPNCRKFPDLMDFVILSTIDHFCNSFLLIMFDLNRHGWFKWKMINRKLPNSVVLFRIDVSYLIQSMAALNHYKDQVKDKVS